MWIERHAYAFNANMLVCVCVCNLHMNATLDHIGASAERLRPESRVHDSYPSNGDVDRIHEQQVHRSTICVTTINSFPVRLDEVVLPRVPARDHLPHGPTDLATFAIVGRCNDACVVQSPTLRNKQRPNSAWHIFAQKKVCSPMHIKITHSCILALDR